MRKRIPTLLALTLLISLIAFGAFLSFYNQKQQNNQKSILSPKYLTTANLSDTSISVTWQTSTPTISKLQINNQTLTDDRDDPQKPTQRLTHFFTVTGLTPNTDYQFQIQNNDVSFSETAYQFKTLSTDLAEKSLNSPGTPPIRGTILNDKLEPADEAIIILNLKDASPKATFITTAGNFILPLTKLTNAQHTDSLTIPDKSPATLEIRKNELVSLVQLTIPVKDLSLPAITLGKNDNIIDFLAQPPKSPQPLEFQIKDLAYDLNNDGKVNTLDSSLVNDLINQKKFNPAADFNNDRSINAADLDIIIKQIK